MDAYEVVEREAQPYAAIPVTVPMEQLGSVVPPLNDEVFGWLAARGVEPAGPPFWKYDLINMPGALTLQVGVGIAGPATGDDRVSVGELPAGRYLQTTHRGHPDSLEAATGDLLAYAATQGLVFDVEASPDGERWASRLEIYLSDPDEQPDLNTWETTLSFRLAD